MRHLTPDTVQQNERNTAVFTEMMMGGMGFQIINDTNYHEYNFYSIIPLTTGTRVTSATYFPGYSGGNISAVELPQGVPIAGDFTSITLSAGSIIGYFMY